MPCPKGECYDLFICEHVFKHLHFSIIVTLITSFRAKKLPYCSTKEKCAESILFLLVHFWRHYLKTHFLKYDWPARDVHFVNVQIKGRCQRIQRMCFYIHRLTTSTLLTFSINPIMCPSLPIPVRALMYNFSPITICIWLSGNTVLFTYDLFILLPWKVI